MDVDRGGWCSSRVRMILLGSCGVLLWGILALFFLFSRIPGGVWDALWNGLVVPLQAAAWLSNASGFSASDLAGWILVPATGLGVVAGISVLAIVRLSEE